MVIDLILDRSRTMILQYPQPTPGRYTLPIQTEPTPELYHRVISNNQHTLIAGTTGSGKSVITNALMFYLAAANFPQNGNRENHCQFILLDPKLVELVDYKNLPHTVFYGFDTDQIKAGLNLAIDTMTDRYRLMQEQKIKKWTDARLIVVFDEIGDIFLNKQLKSCTEQVTRLLSLGRAAGIQLICNTQKANFLPTTVRANIPCSVGLRCRNGVESRLIIGESCCETLTGYGKAYYFAPDTEKSILLPAPMVTDADIAELIRYWERQAPPKRKPKPIPIPTEPHTEKINPVVYGGAILKSIINGIKKI